MKRILIAAGALLLMGSAAFGQTRSETKLYDRTLAKPSVKAYDKFLKKYPSSVYADDIKARRDTLLYISPYSAEDASRLLSTLLPEGYSYKAVASRNEGVDRLYAICIGADSLSLGDLRFISFEKKLLGRAKTETWEKTGTYELAAADADGMSSREFADSSFSFKLRGTDYLYFNYLLSSADRTVQRYVSVCYAPADGTFDYVSFSGKNALEAGDGGQYRIVGRNDMVLDENKPQVRLMLQRIKENPRLEAIPERDYQTDLAIEWWLSNNDTSKSGKLSFNILPAECSLVEDFAGAKGKVSSAKYSAVILDRRGYTVIVVYQKASKDYVLAWAEPECRNKRTDRLLNSLSFDGPNTLEMFYYQGNRMFKFHLNLASKQLSKR